MVRRVGKQIILEPVDEWSAAFVETLGSWEGEIERPPSKPISKKKDPFG